MRHKGSTTIYNALSALLPIILIVKADVERNGRVSVVCGFVWGFSFENRCRCHCCNLALPHSSINTSASHDPRQSSDGASYNE